MYIRCNNLVQNIKVQEILISTSIVMPSNLSQFNIKSLMYEKQTKDKYSIILDAIKVNIVCLNS